MENKLDGATSIGQMMRCLARLPDLIRRGTIISHGEGEDLELLGETRTFYQTCKALLGDLRHGFEETQGPVAYGASQSPATVQAQAYRQSSYGLGLTIVIIFSCVLSALDIGNTELASERTYFSEEILALVEPAARFRPVGASYMVLCLIVAWAGTTDCSVRSLAEAALGDYQLDLPYGRAISSTLALEETFRHLHLLDEYRR